MMLKLTNFAATSNQWKLWCTARILCLNKSFQRNCTISTGIPNVGVWCKNDSFRFPESDKKIRLRLPVFLGIQPHPKTSDFLRLRLRNLGKNAPPTCDRPVTRISENMASSLEILNRKRFSTLLTVSRLDIPSRAFPTFVFDIAS